jgi:hypothetical protein
MRHRGPAGGESRVEERLREASGSIQGRSGPGLGRLSWVGRQSTMLGLAASADSVGAGGRGSGAGAGHRSGGGGQEGGDCSWRRRGGADHTGVWRSSGRHRL